MGGSDVTASIGNYHHLSIKGRQCEVALDQAQRDSGSLEDQFTYPGRLSAGYPWLRQTFPVLCRSRLPSVTILSCPIKTEGFAEEISQPEACQTDGSVRSVVL